jgi:hypothetical protein
MNGLRERLSGAVNAVPDPAFGLDALERKRDRRELRRRSGAGALGLGILAMIGVGLYSLSLGRPPEDAAGDRLPPPSAVLAFPPDAFAYERSAWVTLANDGSAKRVAYDQQRWYGLDASGRRHDQRGHDEVFGAGEYITDAGDVTYLIADPEVLYDQLVERAEPGGASPEAYRGWTLGAEAPITAGVVRSIGELLEDDNVSPELRAALAQVLSGLEGASVQHDVIDPAGRAAISVEIETERRLKIWWFDPDSLQVMAYTEMEAGEDPDEANIFKLVAAAGFVPDINSSKPVEPLVPEITMKEGAPLSVKRPR